MVLHDDGVPFQALQLQPLKRQPLTGHAFAASTVEGPAFEASTFEGPAFDAWTIDASTFDVSTFEGPVFEAPTFEGRSKRTHTQAFTYTHTHAITQQSLAASIIWRAELPGSRSKDPLSLHCGVEMLCFSTTLAAVAPKYYVLIRVEGTVAPTCYVLL